MESKETKAVLRSIKVSRDSFSDALALGEVIANDSSDATLQKTIRYMGIIEALDTVLDISYDNVRINSY